MRPTEHRVLHYDLSHLDQERAYTFRHASLRLPLRRHTPQTIAAARAAMPVLRLIPDGHLTHFVEAEPYADAIGINSVTEVKQIDGHQVNHVVHMAVHVPLAGIRAGQARYRRHLEELARARGHERGRLVHPKLVRHGVTHARAAAVLGDGDGGLPDFPEHITCFNDALDAAVTLLYHHQNLINLNTDDGGSTPQYLVELITDAVEQTDDLPLEILNEKDAWLITTPITQPDGTVLNSTVPSDPVQALTTGPLQLALTSSQNDPELEHEVWRPQYGVTSSTFGATVTGPVAPQPQPQPGDQATVELTAGADAGNWAAKNLTPSNGLSVDGGSIRYSPPPTTATWTGTGLWSIADAIPLPYAGTGGDPGDLPRRLAAGEISIVVTSDAHPDGVLTGVLVPAGTDPDTCQSLYTVAFAPTGPGIVTTATATASCALNVGVSGLTYAITVEPGQEPGLITAGFVYPDPSGAPGEFGQAPLRMSDATGYGTLSIECTNNWLRHLSACVQWIGSDGKQLRRPSNWVDRIPEGLRDPFEQDQDTPFVALVSPVSTVFGVPIPNKPVRIEVPVWDEVATVRFKWGGLGTGAYDGNVAPIGLTMTCMAELALPVFLLWATAAVMDTAIVKSIIADSDVLFATCTVGGFLVAGGTAAYIGTAQDPGAAAEGLATKFAPLFVNPLLSLGKWIWAQELEAEVEDCIPFIDAALKVLNAAVTAAQLAQTTVEVLQSPFVYETDLTRSVELDVTLTPDPAIKLFPDYHDHVTVTVTYDTGATAAVVTTRLTPPTGTLSDPITVKFPAIPSGGNVKVLVAFYSDTDWQSGQGQSQWVDTVVDSGVLDVAVTVYTNEIPLDLHSVYQHEEKIGLLADGSNQLGWLSYPGKPPTATVGSQPYASQGKVVNYLAGITLAQSPEMIGYCWQATGLNLPPNTPDQQPSKSALWTLQNLSVMQHPATGLSWPKVGFTAQPMITYDLASADDGTGANYFLDPTRGTFDPDTNPAGGLHVRRLPLTATGAPTFTVGDDVSYGRFPVPMDRCALHPQGMMFGINNSMHKIFVLDVLGPDEATADADAPMATQAAGRGERDGLIYAPVAICTALDGRLLVLESGNQRVQAFDTYGKPVAYFANPDYDPADPDSTPTIPTMALAGRAQTHLLDLSVESMGYIYVLSYTGDGGKPSQYHLDLYNPDGSWLVSTANVTAARLTVDLLRSMYTLNYETILDAGGRVQPSVSKWLPPAPTGTAAAERTA